MDKQEDIERYNRRKKARIAKKARMDWQDIWRDQGTLDEYDHTVNRAQSQELNPPSAVRRSKPVDFEAEREAFEQRINSYRRRGNFGQLHGAISSAPEGSAISYDGDDWVKHGEQWRPREQKPLRAIDFARKLMQDGQDVEYTENGNKLAAEHTAERIRELWQDQDKGSLGKLLESRDEGDVMTIGGKDYHKDGYLKWDCGDSKIGSRGMMDRLDACGGIFKYKKG